MKNRLFVALMIVGLLGPGCSKKNEFRPPPSPSVSIQHPVREDVTIFEEFPGQTSASDSVDIRARIRGYLKSIEFTDGQRVGEGDLLFTIEPDEYLAAAKTVEARLQQAEAALKLADARLTRINSAWETKAVSEVDKLTAEAEQQSAQAGVMEARAALDNARLNLSYTKIRAPFDGRIAERVLSVGNLVGNGESTLLTTIVDEKPIYIYFTIDERSLLALGEQDAEGRVLASLPSVKLRLADGSIHGEEGRIDYRDSELDPETGTLQARAVFPNQELRLVPGLYGKIMIPRVLNNVTLVPDLALQRDLTGPFVLTVNADNVVERRPIQPGPLSGAMRVVEEGLDVDDLVIVKGLQRARPGITVQTEMEEPVE